jgi:hypothetical protein
LPKKTTTMRGRQKRFFRTLSCRVVGQITPRNL